MSLQSAKAGAFLSMVSTRRARVLRGDARVAVDTHRRRAKTCEDMALALVDGDGAESEYAERGLAEAWDAHQELQEARRVEFERDMEVKSTFQKHQAKIAELVEAMAEAAPIQRW